MATFGNILEELRKDRKMTQKELSEVIYVTTGTILIMKMTDIYRTLKSS